VFGVNYDFTTDYIRKQWDARGNEAGIEIDPEDGFIVDYNDWGNPNIYGNKVKSFRANEARSGYAIFNNNGGGDIHDNIDCVISENVLTDENNNIRYNSGYTIHKNELLGNADIDTNVNTEYNTIEFCRIEGDIKDNTNVVVYKSRVGYNGKIKDCTSLSVTDSIVLGLFEDNTRINLLRTRIEEGGRLRNKSSVSGCPINDSVLYDLNETSETYTDAITIHQSLGKISSSFIIGAGTFTIPTGGGFSQPTVTSGCAATEGRINGIDIDTDDWVFIVKHSGYYVYNHSTSGTVSNAAIVEVMAYKNSTPIPEWYNKKKYSASDSWQISNLPNYPVWLDKGDVISIRYHHDYGGTLTVTLGQINKTLKYDN